MIQRTCSRVTPRLSTSRESSQEQGRPGLPGALPFSFLSFFFRKRFISHFHLPAICHVPIPDDHSHWHESLSSVHTHPLSVEPCEAGSGRRADPQLILIDCERPLAHFFPIFMALRSSFPKIYTAHSLILLPFP